MVRRGFRRKPPRHGHGGCRCWASSAAAQRRCTRASWQRGRRLLSPRPSNARETTGPCDPDPVAARCPRGNRSRASATSNGVQGASRTQHLMWPWEKGPRVVHGLQVPGRWHVQDCVDITAEGPWGHGLPVQHLQGEVAFLCSPPSIQPPTLRCPWEQRTSLGLPREEPSTRGRGRVRSCHQHHRP